jgi:hypothetical protein
MEECLVDIELVAGAIRGSSKTHHLLIDGRVGLQCFCVLNAVMIAHEMGSKCPMPKKLSLFPCG